MLDESTVVTRFTRHGAKVVLERRQWAYPATPVHHRCPHNQGDVDPGEPAPVQNKKRAEHDEKHKHQVQQQNEIGKERGKHGLFAENSEGFRMTPVSLADFRHRPYRDPLDGSHGDTHGEMLDMEGCHPRQQEQEEIAMDNRTLISIAAALGIFSIGQAAVGEVDTTTFEGLDVDGNGYISADEARARADLTTQWETADQDRDGKLNSAEFSAFEGIGRFVPPEDSEIAEPGAAPYR